MCWEVYNIPYLNYIRRLDIRELLHSRFRPPMMNVSNLALFILFSQARRSYLETNCLFLLRNQSALDSPW